MFHLIVDAVTGKAATTHGSAAIERFWLCDKCSKTLTLVPRCVDGVPPIQVQVVAYGKDRTVPAWTEEHFMLAEEHRVFVPTLPARRTL